MKKNQINQLFQSVKELIERSQNQIVRNINSTMVFTYFQIGKMIVEDEQNGKERANYANETLKKLSESLTKDFGRGYSVDNLQNMRAFFIEYRNYETVSSISVSPAPNSETVHRNLPRTFNLSWSHYVQLLKIKDKNEREFYEIETANGNWSVRELQRQFSTSLYERLALSRNKEEIKQLAERGQVMEKSTDTLKSPLVLEFLDLREDNRYSENDLETAIINKLEHFMLELGKGFSFEGRQRRITLEGDHFYVDLVFYNRLLKCFVLFDLKIGKLTHQDIGQMQMYVNYYDRKIKLPEEKPTLGIILCKQDNKSVVEFTLPLGNDQIFSKEYKLYLPSKEDLKKQLE
ncbi:YhcG family protein [Mucilaginibacter sp. RCC_168]|uniref:PDDEXK nuclease domain-containing protein n=1 Tax=Mucilaginibacter sp. RCC_168 TaxID=3239221 RepID=UPI003523246E